MGGTRHPGVQRPSSLFRIVTYIRIEACPTAVLRMTYEEITSSRMKWTAAVAQLSNMDERNADVGV